jgi:hypothetical protein
MTTKDRIKANIVISPAGCWEWQGCVKPNGYCNIKLRNPRRNAYAHRVSYAEFVGPIPEGMFVCHHCDNRRCVNPDHLFLGTHKQNLDDASAKRRMSHGEGRYNSKLSKKDLPIIIQLAEEGVSQQAIAGLFGVHQMTISSIVRRKKWRHELADLGLLEK